MEIRCEQLYKIMHDFIHLFRFCFSKKNHSLAFNDCVMRYASAVQWIATQSVHPCETIVNVMERRVQLDIG
jgi:hypothetical protein